MKVYMSYAECVEYLQTTIFSDEISQTIFVTQCSKMSHDGVPLEPDQYAVRVVLEDGMEYRKEILFHKVRDKTPYYFRSLDKVFNELLWKYDSTLKMTGSLHKDFYEKEIFYSKD